MPASHAASSGSPVTSTLAISETQVSAMNIFPTYEAIEEIKSFPENRRFDVFNKAHHELKRSSKEYKKTCRFYNWAMMVVLAVGFIPMPFAFIYPFANLFVSMWSIFGTILLLGLAYNAQRFINAEIGRYLKTKKSQQDGPPNDPPRGSFRGGQA